MTELQRIKKYVEEQREYYELRASEGICEYHQARREHDQFKAQSAMVKRNTSNDMALAYTDILNAIYIIEGELSC